MRFSDEDRRVIREYLGEIPATPGYRLVYTDNPTLLEMLIGTNDAIRRLQTARNELSAAEASYEARLQALRRAAG